MATPPEAAAVPARPRILLTRPQPHSDRLAARLATEGFEPVVAPLLAIAPLTDSRSERAIKQRVLELDRYDWVLYVSANAAERGLDWLESYWPQWPLRLRHGAVGAATAAVLREAGLDPVTGSGAMNSEALLACPELADVRDQQILICRGQGGRETLAETLRERGARVDYCELYRRQRDPEARDRLAALCHNDQARFDLAVIASGDTLTIYTALLDALNCPGRQRPLLVPGERVAAQARAAGFAQVLTCEHPGDDAVLAALNHWRQQRAR